MNEPIIVVSGLPRSGTSMMMKMLEAGGIPPLTDEIRAADDDNPKGYYEFERVKGLPDDTGWIPDARGKTVKVISQLLTALPEGETYRVIFMMRKLVEVLASQKKMLENRGTEKEGGPSDETMAEIMEKHLVSILAKVERRPDMKLLPVSYNNLIARPAEIVPKVADFLGGALDQGAMVAAIDKKLYRQRAE